MDTIPHISMKTILSKRKGLAIFSPLCIIEEGLIFIFLKYKIFLQTIHFQSFHYTHFSVIQEYIFLIDLIFIDNTSYNRRQIILFYCKITLQ